MLDDRQYYGEDRFRVWGYLHGRRVSLVWTPRGNRRRIITMRHAHGNEHKARLQTLD
ncbi:BrnT family toxin [Novosphingobium sp.]|uniref:BrnT family toxin n=1 Tax=Novosphingobium sp. TaxID=1874826 RepID=UPI0034577206